MKCRKAERDDVKEIVRLLVDDELGNKREQYKAPQNYMTRLS